MAIVDSHVHYWEPASADRPWDPKGLDLGPPWSTEALLAEMSAAGIDRIVQVTPTVMNFDNRYSLEGVAKHPDRIVGVFGRFDPTLPQLRERLAAFAELPYVLGIRTTALQPAHLAWFDDGTIDRFLEAASGLPLVMQLYAPGYPKKIAAAARAHPGVTIFVDHMGVQHREADPFAEVWNDVLALRAFPNVYLKLSAFPECAHEPYPFPRMRRYVRDLYETFGPDRLIWGSNFPPSLKACSLAESVAFFRDLPFIPDRDKEKICGQTLLKALGR